MSLLVQGVASSAPTPLFNAANLLTNPELTSVQQAQIAQILAELQTGTITQVEARAEINSVLAAQAQRVAQGAGAHAAAASSGSATGSAVANNAHESSSYEMPLPQEQLPKGLYPAYTWIGSANSVAFSAPTLNATA